MLNIIDIKQKSFSQILREQINIFIINQAWIKEIKIAFIVIIKFLQRYSSFRGKYSIVKIFLIWLLNFIINFRFLRRRTIFHVFDSCIFLIFFIFLFLFKVLGLISSVLLQINFLIFFLSRITMVLNLILSVSWIIICLWIGSLWFFLDLMHKDFYILRFSQYNSNF